VVKANRSIVEAEKKALLSTFLIFPAVGVKLISALWKRCSLGCFLIRLEQNRATPNLLVSMKR